MCHFIEHCIGMKPLLDLPKLKDKNTWPAPSAGLGLTLAQLYVKTPKLYCVVTPDTMTAERLQSELTFYLKQASAPIAYFPDWEVLPYDLFSPHGDIVSQRIELLSTLTQWQQGILILPMHTLMQKLPPVGYFAQHGFKFNVGEPLALTAFKDKLVQYGYHHTNQVYHHGEFATRGSIIDLFPSGLDYPIRIELFDDEIESIRFFDPDTQTSSDTVHTVDLRPAHEYPFDEAGRETFRANWRAQFEGDPTRCSIYHDVGQGVNPGGIESYLPLFFDQLETLFDYLPSETCFIKYPQTSDASQQYWKEVHHRYEQRAGDITRPLLPPESLYLPPEMLFNRLNQTQLLSFSQSDPTPFYPLSPLPELNIQPKLAHPLVRLDAYIHDSNTRILLVAESAGRKEVLLELLAKHHQYPHEVADWHAFLATNEPVCITVAPIHEGVTLTDVKLSLITEDQLFGEQVAQKRRQRSQKDLGEIIKDLAELTPGMAVVHFEHGVGRYKGLTTIDIGELQQEFLTLEYANATQLHVPLHDLHLISRYSAADTGNAPLHTLGSAQWQKTKEKAAKRIRDSAAELLEIYAKRAAKPGHAYAVTESYQQFARAFPFEETADQHAAIDAVIEDMVSPHPMDRLVCGDVGFGKTEVAMRAAFIAAEAGKQVLCLVPTTLLAQQHYETFCDRFADWPFKIAVLSRFQTAKTQTDILAGLANGKVDIVIGTHKLLQKDLKLKDLGLLIIDEEHRFGVHQKEKIKSLRTDVDTLTLTATPIPRTLNLAFSGLRDLSMITTPPAKRLSVKTFVHEHSKAMVIEAVSRELMRGGQVYYLHNNVETIHSVRDELTDWLPQARIAIAHGQMRERELEQTMADFYHHKYNVLVCTTIIETGIDIPTANTIIMDRADKFGLAQLHQLRGRVGRSHHQAYAYLLTPHKSALRKDAKARLEAISRYDELGVGFNLASEDLEIRGAGDILGEGQSGHMQEIGYTLYTELMAKAVKAIRNGETWTLDAAVESSAMEINLPMSCLFPEDYIYDVQTRLRLYKRLANCESREAIHALQSEVIDRFGPLPPAAKALFSQTQLQLVAHQLGVKSISGAAQSVKLAFAAKPKVDPGKLIELIQTQSDLYQLSATQALTIQLRAKDENDYFDTLFKRLSPLEAVNA